MFESQIRALSERVLQHKDKLETEEATKNALVMPFIMALGYDVFNPNEVIPEFVADVSGKRGEKVDYCICMEGEPIMIIECKNWNENLDLHSTQLQRYFTFTKAKFGILTNGVKYLFYTDLNETNVMDDRPFLVVDLVKIKDNQIKSLSKFHKDQFDHDAISNSANELKYVSLIKEVLKSEFSDPSMDFTKLITGQVYEGLKTQAVLDQFRIYLNKATAQFFSETVNERLQKAIVQEQQEPTHSEEADSVNEDIVYKDEEKGIVTTKDEIRAFEIICEILKDSIDIGRIHHRDTKSYFGILIDDNNRKPIAKLYTKRSGFQLLIINKQREEKKYDLSKIEHIYMQAKEIRLAAKSYLDDL